MGSSSAKRFSLRSIIGSAAALIFLVLLLLVAGGVATLHHSPARGVAVSANDRLLPRKVLRLEVIQEASSSGSIDFANQQQHRPPPQPQLPRGLVHKTTNLEMEPSLAGDPERRTHEAASAAPTTKPKSLLAVPVGIKNKAVVDKLVPKFAAADFTVMLFHYDGAASAEQWGRDDLEWWDRAVHVAAKGQTKWWFAKRFLHPDVVADYDYVFVWDEDVEVDAFDPAAYLAVVRRERLDVSQPALDRRSQIHHAITARPLLPTPDGVHRRVRDARCGSGDTGPPCGGWVEVMVPVFSRAAWRCAWGMLQNDLIHGWGLDYRLGYCATGDRALTVGVVDTEYVLHRGVPMLSDDGGSGKATPSSAGRAAVRLRSFREMQIFNRRWEAAAAEDDSWTDPYKYGSTASDGQVKSSR